MTGHKKKPARRRRSLWRSWVCRQARIVVLLIAAALISGLLLTVSGQSTTQGSEAKNSKSGHRSLFANDPNFSTKIRQGSHNSATQELFIKTMLAVLLVIILGVAAIYTSKKLLPKITQGGALGWISATLSGPNRKIHILETAHLGPKKAVHLIEIGNHQYLVGSSNENITMLAELDTQCSMMDTRQESSVDPEPDVLLDGGRIENVRI